MHKVLFVATSNNTKGGITSVINAYKQCPFWNKYKIKWIETHIDKNFCIKFLYFIGGFIQYAVLIWSYDIVHIHTGDMPSFIRKYPFYKLAKLFKKKIVLHIHIGTQIEKMTKHKTAQKLLQNSHRIIVLSNDLKEKLVSLFYLKKEKIHVIYNPCTPVKNIHYTDRFKTILFAGRLEHNKGYHLLLNAFAMIAPKHPDWRIVFAGNGEIQNAKSIAQENKLSDQVVFLGWISGNEKDEVFRKATVLCLASYAEGFPMTILDAWAYGLPVICTPVGGLQDIVKNKINTLLFEPGNIQQLANQLELMITNTSIRSNIAKASFELSKTTFNLQNIGNQLDKLYANLLQN